MMNKFLLKIAALTPPLFVALGLSGCVSVSNNAPPRNDYDAAIVDAAVVSPEKIMSLRPIPSTPSVSVISWVSESRVPCRANESSCIYTTGSDRMWVTLAGEVQSLCRSWNLNGDALRQRLEQLLGLPANSPPQYRKVKFVVMELARDRLERACLGVNDADAAHPVCMLDTQASTSPELRNYVQQQMAGAYILRNPKGPGYPFTRLGYTYDWNPLSKAANHYGASEFLLLPNTPVNVTAQYSTDAYCKVGIDIDFLK